MARVDSLHGIPRPFDEKLPKAMASDMANWCNDASKISAYVNNYYGGAVVTREQCAKMIEARRNRLVRHIPDWDEPEVEAKPVLKLVLPTFEPAPVRERPPVIHNGFFDVRALIQNVADDLGVSYGEVIGRSRLPRFIDARSVIVMVLLGRGWSLMKIARVINRSDHTTIRNLRDNFPIYCRRNPEVAEAFERYRMEGVA